MNITDKHQQIYNLWNSSLDKINDLNKKLSDEIIICELLEKELNNLNNKKVFK